MLFRSHFLVPRITILRVDDADVGYYRLDEEDHGLYLAGLYIEAPVRRRGLGRAVLQDLIERAQRDRKDLALHVLRPNPARALYERLGFVVTDEEPERFRMTWHVPAE